MRARRLSLGVRFPPPRAVLVWLRASRGRAANAPWRAPSSSAPHRALSPFPSTRMALKTAAGRAARRRAPPPPPRRAGRRPAAAPLVVVLSGRSVNKKTRRRRHSRVVCVRNPADCEVKSGALLRWRSPQALAMSHLRGLGFARDRNHQKRHFRSEVSHLSCIARASGAPPSKMRPA